MSRKTILLILCILLASTIGIIAQINGENSKISWVVFTTILMASLWISEAIPMGVTSLLPMIIFPLAGVLSMKETTINYGNQIIFLFIAGFLLAFAMEKCGLHRRLAFFIIRQIGVSPLAIIAGFGIASWFLSMWISNAATAIVLVAPALAIIAEISQHAKEVNNQFAIALLLTVSYAASIGGTCTIIGTAPNLLMVKYFNENFSHLAEINFYNWMLFAFPLGVILLIITLFFIYLKYVRKLQPISSEQIKQRISSLPKMSYEERIVSVVFFIAVLLWVFSHEFNIGNFHIPGWVSIFPVPGHITESTIGIAIAVLLFTIPTKDDPSNRILNWEETKRIPFDILFIFGGGFALSAGIASSGLNLIIGEYFEPLKNLPIWVMVASISLFITFFTEITSNTATTQLMLPLLVILAQSTGINPIYLFVPATFSASYAFMLPVATPPNAIVYSSNLIPLKEMMRSGLFLNLIIALVLSIYVLNMGWLFN